FEQRLGILHDLDHAVAIHVPAAPHHGERGGLELAPRLNMHVDVGDTSQGETRCRPGGTHGAKKLPPGGCALNRTGGYGRAPLRSRDRGVARSPHFAAVRLPASPLPGSGSEVRVLPLPRCTSTTPFHSDGGRSCESPS